MAQKSELEHSLEKASRYLKSEFGLERPEADICSEYDLKGPAFYNPKEDKISLSSESSIADLVHEYFGHALYSKQSTLGKKLKQNLELISDIEDKYKIPKDASLNIKHSKGFKVEKLKKDEYILFCDTNDSKIQGYIKLKKETEDLFNKTTPLQEGFSIWMEEKILKQLGLIDLWESRRKMLIRTPYFDFYNSFLKEESEKGAITLLYKLGFPKSKDKNIITKVAEENLENFDRLKYLIQYGSLERDIDMVAVYPDNLIDKEGLIYDGCMDINVLSETSFLQRAELYDIEISEPILTGNLLIGEEKSFNDLRSKIKTGKPSNEAVEYANSRSLETFNSALFFYHQNKFKCNESLLSSNNLEEAARTILEEKVLDFCTEDTLYALNNLSFSLSYNLSADHYRKEKSSVSFKTLMKNNLLGGLVSYMKDVENGRGELSEHKTFEFINKIRDFLLKNFNP